MNLFVKVLMFVTVASWWEILITYGEYGCCDNENQGCDCTVKTTVTYSQITSNETTTEVTDSNGTTRVYTTTVNVSTTATDTKTTNNKIVVGNDSSNGTTTAVSTAVATTVAPASAAASQATTSAGAATYGSCKALNTAGYTTNRVYNITVGSTTMEVYCIQDVDSGGWTVIQRRFSGNVDFYLDWNSYKDGFGNKSEEYWLGLENIYNLLQTGSFELRIDLGNSANVTRYAKYQYFEISAESGQYALNNISGYSGNAGDSLSSHLNANFTTRDQDNDQMSGHNCAVLYTGAWWYKQCYDSNLNGQYGATEGRGVVWNTWHTGSLIRSTTMSIRER